MKTAAIIIGTIWGCALVITAFATVRGMAEADGMFENSDEAARREWEEYIRNNKGKAGVG